jgi:hypothetical protein
MAKSAADCGAAEREPGEVAYGVDGDLRAISTRLDAQVAVGFLRVQLVCAKVGQPLQPGCRSAKPNRLRRPRLQAWKVAPITR